MLIKTLVFDIDNTLYDYDAAHGVAFRALIDFACQKLGMTEERFLTLHKEGNQRLRAHTGSVCAAVHNRLIRYQLMLEQIGQPISYAPKLAHVYWSTLLSAMEPASGAKECLAFLKRAGYTVGIGTNMTADYQFAKLERLGLLDDVDFLVSSEEAGVEKPDRRLFDLCVEKAGCRPEECVFVGDDLECDARGAERALLHPVWLCREAQPHEDLTGIDCIYSLTELPALLQSL